MAANIAEIRRNIKNVAHNYTDAQVRAVHIFIGRSQLLKCLNIYKEQTCYLLLKITEKSD